jgi:hypothetical protein
MKLLDVRCYTVKADTSSAKIQPQVINLLGVFLFLDFSF